MDILIVGAGPTGLTVALELARRGLNPLIIDKRDSASTLSRAVGITPRSLQLLSSSGVSERLIAEGIAMDGLQVYRGDKLLLKLTLHSDWAFYPTVIGLPQDRTEAIMAETLTSRGVGVRYGLAINGFHEEDNRVNAKFSDGSEQSFDAIVGADGIGSTIRESQELVIQALILHKPGPSLMSM